jgi:uridine monophosphate synthetase
MTLQRNEFFIEKLCSIGAIKFGNFKLKSGRTSPYYVDLRLLISYPDILKLAGNLLTHLFKNQKLKTPNILCGIPAAGVPIATILSQKVNCPLIINKKEPIIYEEIIERIRSLETLTYSSLELEMFNKIISRIANLSKFKNHGLQKYVDGNIREHARIGLVDDLITTAKSKIEVIKLLMHEKKRIGLKDVQVTDVYVLLDREQGGAEILKNNGIIVHSVLKITEIFHYLAKTNQIDENFYESIVNYIKSSKD